MIATQFDEFMATIVLLEIIFLIDEIRKIVRCFSKITQKYNISSIFTNYRLLVYFVSFSECFA
jgi:hypothetical protein